MKIQHKLMIILFFGMIVFHHLNCYAIESISFIYNNTTQYTVALPDYNENIKPCTKTFGYTEYRTQPYHFFIYCYDYDSVYLYVPMLSSVCFDNDISKTLYDISKMYVKRMGNTAGTYYGTYVYNTHTEKYDFIGGSDRFYNYSYFAIYKYNFGDFKWEYSSSENISSTEGIYYGNIPTLVNYSTLDIKGADNTVLKSGKGAYHFNRKF